MATLSHLVRGAKRRAWQAGPFHGDRPLPYTCCFETPARTDREAVVRVIFTLDCGMHMGGWWKNSEYDRCWHLSLTMRTASSPLAIPETPTHAEQDVWVHAFFDPHAAWVWFEPATNTTPAGKAPVHYRLFLNQDLDPILPRGEVYTLVPYVDGSSPAKIFGRAGA